MRRAPLPAFNGYQRRNRYDTWRFERAQGNYTISQPTFALYPTKDPVADWAGVALALGSYKFLTNHYNAVSAHGLNSSPPRGRERVECVSRVLKISPDH